MTRFTTGQPVFVLSLPRSGSTLLRYLLDSHSVLACPPETQMSVLCTSVLECWLNFQDPDGFEARKALGVAEARRAARRIMAWHLQESGKAVFCDKSLPNAERAHLLADLFPRARFICLYRHPMDFIASAVESSRWGYSGYGLYPYVVGTADNVVFGLARAWCEKTAAILALEERWARRCVRVSYERLVTTPAEVWREITDFLRVPAEPGAVDSALRRSHLRGYGDHKILMTDEVNTDSLGRGSCVPLHLLTAHGLANVNSLMSRVGYPVMETNWNLSPSSLRYGLLSAEHQRLAANELTSYLNRRVSIIHRRFGDCGGIRVRVLIEEFGEPRGWMVDFSQPSVGDDDSPLSTAASIVARLRTLKAVQSGTLSLSQAVSQGEIRFNAVDGDNVSLARVVGLLLRPEDSFADEPDDGTMGLYPSAVPINDEAAISLLFADADL